MIVSFSNQLTADPTMAAASLLEAGAEGMVLETPAHRLICDDGDPQRLNARGRSHAGAQLDATSVPAEGRPAELEGPTLVVEGNDVTHCATASAIPDRAALPWLVSRCSGG